MKPKTRRRFSIVIWLAILMFLAVVLTFPKWITVFYPQPHRDLVLNASLEHQVDPYLVFGIIRAESKYQSQARSPVGAIGLMQIMPATGQWIAEQQGLEEFDPIHLQDPQVNIDFGCWYLASLSAEFDGQIPLVVAAYNAGRGTVQQWIAAQIWNGDPEQLEDIPFEETQQYVLNVLKNYQAYQVIYTDPYRHLETLPNANNS